MAPKKPPAKAASTTKKAAVKKATPTKATPKKPDGLVKKTPTKTASAVKKADGFPIERPRRLRTLPPSKTQSEVQFSPNAYISPSSILNRGYERKHATEIFRRYGAAAVEAYGYHQTVLLNACMNLAWKESAASIYPKTGERKADGSVEGRWGAIDDNHKGKHLKWSKKMRKMEDAMMELLGKDQTERQKAFFAVPHPKSNPDDGTAEEKKKWAELRKLAAYYKEHPDEGNEVVHEKKSATKKTPVKSAAGMPRRAAHSDLPTKTASAVEKPTKAAATPKSARPKYEIIGDVLKRQSQTPYSPDTDVTQALKALWADRHLDRAAEIFRLYGAAALEQVGWDQTVLLNACLNIAFQDSESSITPRGSRYSDRSQDSRFGLADINHFRDQWTWIGKMGAMEEATIPLLRNDCTERQAAFYDIWEGQDSQEDDKKEQRDLALFYKQHLEEGHEVVGTKKTAGKTAGKKVGEKVAGAATPVKKTPVKKSATKSATKTPPYTQRKRQE